MMGLLAGALAILSLTAPIDGVVDAAARQGLAGEVLVADSSHTLYARAVSAPGRPHHGGERWRWASVTKQLTATLVMQQVAAGTLSLDDTLAARLPAFGGATARRITLRMLLQHTSGLPNPDDTPAAANAMPGFYLRIVKTGSDDALGFCAGKPKAEPGTGFAYNNCDTIVLGAVLEGTTGLSYARLLQRDIAVPLHLATLTMAQTGSGIAQTVRGVGEDGRSEPPVELATFGPAGAATGSAMDLVRFDQALLTNRLLPPDATAVMWTGDTRLGYVALGAWSFPAPLKGCSGAVPLVERRGEIGGVEVRNLLAPKLGRALVVFADRAGLDFGEIWQGKGLSYDLASAAFCSVADK
jgi:D-alanyl-D-alanine carboxypeptidase